MAIPDILALDFDGVLCDGMREYFEASRRTYRQTWRGAADPGDAEFAAFRRLRPVIMSGWEMPLLLRAIATGAAEADIERSWEPVRDGLVARGVGSLEGPALVASLTHALDEVRRQWIAADLRGWIAANVPYCSADELRRLVAEPDRSILVTTKEGEFARRILDDWGVHLADVQGKEAGTHKCENLRALIARFQAERGRRPRVWFVEDRLETLRHVTTHPDLEDVGLFLAAWGYNTEATRASIAGDPRVALLELDRFRQGTPAWPTGRS